MTWSLSAVDVAKARARAERANRMDLCRSCGAAYDTGEVPTGPWPVFSGTGLCVDCLIAERAG